MLGNISDIINFYLALGTIFILLTLIIGYAVYKYIEYKGEE